MTEQTDDDGPEALTMARHRCGHLEWHQQAYATEVGLADLEADLCTRCALRAVLADLAGCKERAMREAV